MLCEHSHHVVHLCDLDFPWVKAQAISRIRIPILRITNTSLIEVKTAAFP